MAKGKEDDDLWNRPPLTPFRTIADRQLGDTRFSRRFLPSVDGLVDLFLYGIILVPLHFTIHWRLATIDLRKKHIAYYDSMESSRERHNCLHKLQLYLEAESQYKRGHGLDWEPWKLQVISDLPQQHNDSVCGIFTCQYAECVSRDAKISFGQQHMPYFRKRVVYEILHGQLLPV
ncbi:sentrin-specific protease 1-like [Ixodes scapularis]|uniref:sentrin-specific protease 1-like n=1 Tax=Ixodes scapularis TaxID=6945 RepID=UPI001A9EA962|nr:sentrin-specific protease 1-like [Ixodes scapularis]